MTTFVKRINLNFVRPAIFTLSRINIEVIFFLLPFAYIFGQWLITSLVVLIFFYFIIAESFLLREKIFIKAKIPLLLILLAGFNAMQNAPKLITGVQYFIGTIIIPLMIFIAVTNSRLSIKSIIRYANLNILTGVVLGLYSLYLAFVLGEVGLRLPSLWEDFNIVSAYLMIIFFFVLTFILHNKDRRVLLIYIAALVPVLLGLFFTQTRGVWLATIVGIAFYFLKRPKVVIPASIFIGVLVVFFFSIFLDRFLSVKNFATDTSALGRLQAWAASALIIKDNWLMGVGFDGFLELRDSIFSFYVVPVLHSHNTYLRLWLEIGLIGFLPYIGFFFMAFYYTFKLTKRYKQNIDVLKVVEAIQLSLVGLIISFMFEPYFSLYGNSTIIIWFLISLTFYLYSKQEFIKEKNFKTS